ncbi:hypothetical protein SAMN02745134_00571 [Clostridium acidisoli DSM 12555]|uniref:Uncharacterized protein n=1 Tax=Clostridium acidisoli DSM 12555 TaxID=1121291 RepID=A0A1W1X3Q3_9CLOT|nr:hypothetical protein [Clostridium acidisoli]SMC18460.1 hypothetical protein SAMN02745134_00571 [Clostridium acidisoli DSM 12555]
MKYLKIFLFIFVFPFCVFVFIKTSSLFLSSNSTSHYIYTNEVEKRGSPVHSWMIGADHLPHMKVFFWVPKSSTTYIPYANQGVRTNVIGHGAINQWAVIQTGQVLGSYKLVFMLVPKTFVFTHGPNFYKLTHIYYR